MTRSTTAEYRRGASRRIGVTEPARRARPRSERLQRDAAHSQRQSPSSDSPATSLKTASSPTKSGSQFLRTSSAPRWTTTSARHFPTTGSTASSRPQGHPAVVTAPSWSSPPAGASASTNCAFHPAVGREMDRYLRNSRFGREYRCAALSNPLRHESFDEDGFANSSRVSARRVTSATSQPTSSGTPWATNFMKVPEANLLELKRQGGWERWEMVERYSHRVPVRDRLALPNPLEPSHKTAFGQPPSARVSRLSRAA
jgi:hypothetical protein